MLEDRSFVSWAVSLRVLEKCWKCFATREIAPTQQICIVPSENGVSGKSYRKHPFKFYQRTKNEGKLPHSFLPNQSFAPNPPWSGYGWFPSRNFAVAEIIARIACKELLPKKPFFYFILMALETWVFITQKDSSICVSTVSFLKIWQGGKEARGGTVNSVIYPQCLFPLLLIVPLTSSIIRFFRS